MGLHDMLDDCLVAEYALLDLGCAIAEAIERENGYRSAMRRPRPHAWWWRQSIRYAVGDA